MTTLLFRVYSFAPLLLQKAIIRAMQLTDGSFRHLCTIAFLIVLLVIDLCWDKKKKSVSVQFEFSHTGKVFRGMCFVLKS